jgi:hypothetical protein
MAWVVGVSGYVVAVALMLRFFRFLSDADRDIERFQKASPHTGKQ